MKLTPLNIVLACILVWMISEWGADQEQIMTWGWLFILVILISLVDLGFRLLFKNIKRLWLMQIGFILVVSVLMVMLKLQ